MLIVERYKQANKNHPNPEINTEKLSSLEVLSDHQHFSYNTIWINSFCFTLREVNYIEII